MSNWTREQHDIFTSMQTQKHIKAFIVEAVAGCGKSAMLIELCKRCANKRILFLAFNRSTVQYIRDCINFEYLDVFTLHSYLLHLHSCTHTSTRVDPALIARLYERSVHRRRVPYSKVRQMVDSIRLRGTHVGLQNSLAYQVARSLVQQTMNCQDIVDFEGLVYIFCMRRENIQHSYDMILIDEAQDLNPAQCMVIANLAKRPGTRLVIVGDQQQSIYGFKVTCNSITQLTQMIQHDHGKQSVQRHTMSVCFRCPEKIIRMVNFINPTIKAAAGSKLGCISWLDNIEPCEIAAILSKRLSTQAIPQTLCLLRSNKEILTVMRVLYHQKDVKRETTKWLSPSIKTDIEMLINKIVGLDEESDGSARDFLDSEGGAIAQYCRTRWNELRATEPSIVMDVSKAVLQIIDTCDPDWWLFLLDNIIETVSSLKGSYVLLSTIHGTKGLTFRGTVAIVNYHRFADEVADRCLLYVAMTRTTVENLFLFTCKTADAHSTLIPMTEITSVR